MVFIESFYAAITLFTAFTLPLLLSIISTLFKEHRLKLGTYKTLTAAAFALSVALFFKHVFFVNLADASVFIGKMAEVNVASLIIYAYMIERTRGRK